MRSDFLKKTKGFITYKRKCTNDGSNAGSQTVKIEPAADSILLIYFVSIRNMDSTARTLSGVINTAGANLVGNLCSASCAAGVSVVFPRSAFGTGYFDIRDVFKLTDDLELLLTAVSIAVSQDADFIILYQYIGTAPTITETGPTDCTWSDIS